MDCGKEAKDKARENRDGEREAKHGAVELDFIESREIVRAERTDCVQPPIGKQESERAAHEGQQQVLGDQLADQAHFSGAQGGANSDLPFSHRGAGEKQVGDVGAGNQEDKRDCPQQHEERWTNVPNELLFQRDEVDAPSAERAVGDVVGILAGKLRRKAVHFRGGLRERDSGLEPREHIQVVAATVLGLRAV